MTRPRNRANSEGSVYQRSRDERWITSVTLPDGTRKSWTFQTQKEALQKLKAHHKQVQEGFIPTTAPRMRLDRFLAEWLEGTVKQSVRPKTYESYAQLIRLYIAPSIGRVSLEELAAHHILGLQNRQLKQGLSTRTVQYTRAVLRRALNQAVRWGLVPRNVTSMVDPPKGERKAMALLSPEEVKTFLGALAGHRLEPLFVTAIALGLRKGELLGLRWQDVDLNEDKLSVRGTLQVIDGKPVVMDTKTKESRRTVALPSVVAKALAKQKVLQAQARLRAGMRWTQTEYVFTSTVGTPLGGRNLSTALDKVLSEAGLPHIRFHDLRHLAASILLDGKMRLKDVSALLGHASTVVTQTIYEHLLDNSGQAVADEMDRFFGTS